ncbi:hypothetical protein HDC95_003362 [Microbacterium sp. AK031]|nr:hypothetical protein [Microbacterium sp. AK031]
MTSNVIPFDAVSSEPSLTTEPDLHSFDYEASK